MKKVFFIFTIIGILMLAGAAFLSNSTYQFIQQAAIQTGTVVAIEQSESKDSYVYHPVVKFVTADNQAIKFRSSIGSNPPSYRIGESVDVIYIPAEPHKAKINSFMSLWFVEIIVAGIGSIFFLIGAIPLFIIRLGKNTRKRLRDTGDRILAMLDRVELNTSFKVNGRNPYRIICQWKDPMAPSKVYIFYSENIWFNPQPHINQKEIAVYIDRNNPRKYYVDISFLPEVA